MLKRLQTLWLFTCSLLMAAAAGGLHWWWSTPVYEAQAAVTLVRDPKLPSPILSHDGELPLAVFDEAARSLSRLDVSLSSGDPSPLLLARDVRCRIESGAHGDEATLRYRTTQPDQAVTVLRTVVASWLKQLGRSTESGPASTTQSEVARLEQSLQRQRQHLETLEKSAGDDAAAPRQRDLQRAAVADVKVDLDEARLMLETVQQPGVSDLPLEDLVKRLSNPVVRSAGLQLLARAEDEEQLRAQQVLRARYEQTYGRNHPKLRSVLEKVARLNESLGDVSDVGSAYERLVSLVNAHKAGLEQHLAKQESVLTDLEGKCQRHAEREASLTNARVELSRLEEDLASARERLAKSSSQVATAEITRPPMLLMQPVWPVPMHHAASSLAAGMILGTILCWRQQRREAFFRRTTELMTAVAVPRPVVRT